MKKTMWIVVLYYKSFPMIGTKPMSHDEALAVVRIRRGYGHDAA